MSEQTLTQAYLDSAMEIISFPHALSLDMERQAEESLKVLLENIASSIVDYVLEKHSAELAGYEIIEYRDMWE